MEAGADGGPQQRRRRPAGHPGRAVDLAVVTGVTARRLQVLRYQKGSAVAALEVAAFGIGMHHRVSPRFTPPSLCTDLEV